MSTPNKRTKAFGADVRVNGKNLLVTYASLLLEEDRNRVTLVLPPETHAFAAEQITIFGEVCEVGWTRVISRFIEILIPPSATFPEKDASDIIIEAIRQVFAFAYTCEAEEIIVNLSQL